MDLLVHLVASGIVQVRGHCHARLDVCDLGAHTLQHRRAILTCSPDEDTPDEDSCQQ